MYPGVDSDCGSSELSLRTSMVPSLKEERERERERGMSDRSFPAISARGDYRRSPSSFRAPVTAKFVDQIKKYSR